MYDTPELKQKELQIIISEKKDHHQVNIYLLERI